MPNDNTFPCPKKQGIFYFYQNFKPKFVQFVCKNAKLMQMQCLCNAIKLYYIKLN